MMLESGSAVWSSADMSYTSQLQYLFFLLIWFFLHGPLFAFIFVFQKVVRHNKKHVLEKIVRDILVYVFVTVILFGATKIYRE